MIDRLWDYQYSLRENIRYILQGTLFVSILVFYFIKVFWSTIIKSFDLILSEESE